MYYHLITKDGLKQKDLSIEEIEKILREEEVNYNNARIYELCQNTRDFSREMNGIFLFTKNLKELNIYSIIKMIIKISNIYFGRGYVYSIQYHIVWCVKYRRKVLINDIKKTLKQLLIEISNENNIKIIEMETDLDHIHILIECSPQHFIPNILKIFKGISARKLFLKHPEIKNKLWNGHLWNPSYFVATVSENTEEQIKRYIQTQKER